MASIHRRHTASGEIRWDVRYRDPDQRQRTRTFHRKVDAQKFANLVEADIARGEWLDPGPGQGDVRRLGGPLGSDDRWPHAKDT